jgi:tRNA A-37 threonylcarbamoyl transferase component Bud32/CheY-like chemotaxis protein
MPLAPPKPGQIVLGSYRIERQLGAGTHAIAYLAQQLGTGRCAVVKLPHPYLLDGPQASEIRRRFEVEARAATRVSHPNVVTVYTVGHTPQGIPAMAMEYVNGEPLSTMLNAAAPLPIVQIGPLGEQLGEALLALHDVGITHRHLSPAKVMIRRDTATLSIKLLDLGVAKQQGRVMPRSDVYSLGAILWWALTGQERVDDCGDGSLLQRFSAPLGPDPLSVNPGAPPELAAIIARMLVAAHERRPSIEEFLQEWRSALDAIAAPRVHAPSFASYERTAPMQLQKVGVVVANPVMRTLATSCLYLGGAIEVVACGPRDLTRANPGDYAVAIIDAQLPDVDVRELLRMLSECHADLSLIVVGKAAQAGMRWPRYGADAFVQLPEELSRLPKEVLMALGRTTTWEMPSGNRLSAPIVAHLRAQGQLYPRLQSFVGHMPQWLGDLRLGLGTQDRARASQACAQLLSSVDALGLRDLTLLAQATSSFIKDNDLTSAVGFVEAIEQAYHEVFAEVFLLIRNNQAKPASSAASTVKQPEPERRINARAPAPAPARP